MWIYSSIWRSGKSPKKYEEKGFSVLAFPCNQFGNQEPGNNNEIQEFCSLNFQTSFPVMSKIDVNGKNADPLFNYLKSEKKGLLGSKGIKWNFTKFLVDQNGEVIKRYSPNKENLIIDIGSNDGTLLEGFKKRSQEII